MTQNKTSVSVGKWPGKEANVTVVDTPDFKLFELKDDNVMDELAELFMNEIKDTNALVLYINEKETKMDQEMQNFLQSIDNAFGNDIWNYVILNPCSWSYDSNSLNERKSLGITEESFVSDWNWQIR